MKLVIFNPKQLRFSPKRLFRSKKDRSAVSRSDPSSVGSGSTTSSSEEDGSVVNRKPGAAIGSVTPTSVLPETPGDISEISAGETPAGVYSELLQAFKLIDKDNDGVVSRSDLERLLSRLGPEPPSQKEVRMMLSEVDTDGGGWISLETLASRALEISSPAYLASGSAEELKETFEFFDVDGDGLISSEELLRVFAAIGDDRCTLDDCQRMIMGVDEDGDGFVCFEEFSRMMDLHRY